MATASTRRRRHATKKGRTGPFVKYVGVASKRTIRPPDWRSLGIASDATHEWSKANNYIIESSTFNDAQLDYLRIDDVGPSGAYSFIEVDTGATVKLS